MMFVSSIILFWLIFFAMLLVPSFIKQALNDNPDSKKLKKWLKISKVLRLIILMVFLACLIYGVNFMHTRLDN